MKLSLNNKIPVLTEEDEPSWHCPDACCFKDLYMGHSYQLCHYFHEIQCSEGYSYILQNEACDVFKL